MLCPFGGYDAFDVFQFYCCGTSKSHGKTIAQCIHLLDYLLSQAYAKVQFHALDMIMSIHSDALYLSDANAQSRACRNFFMGWMPKDGEPILLNRAFQVSTTIMRFAVASAAKAKLRTGIILQPTLATMGHQQPRAPIHCDNATAVNIVNNTIKRQHSRSMEISFFWVGDKKAWEMFALQWHQWQENLADYQSKHHLGSHHATVRPWYLQMEN
jgi:hypothetical protein